MSNNPQQPYFINRDGSNTNMASAAYQIPINVTSMIPNSLPTFTFTEENFDLDFGLLSEYIAEDEGTGGLVSRASSQNNYYSHSQPISCVTSDNDYSSDEDGKRKRSSKGKGQDQLDKRRERNRVLAKKTRLRKKFFFESLQRQVAQLATENDMLKTIVKQRLTNEVKCEILSQCRTEIPSIISASAQQATSLLEKADYRLMSAIQAAQRSFVITDPSLPDNPIIFASKGFLELTGYRLDEVVGRNCRFLQGPLSDQNQVAILRKGIEEGQDTSVCLLNYRRDGTPFYNQIFCAALKDSSNRIINYVGVQVEIKDYDLEQLKDSKNAATLNKPPTNSLGTTVSNSSADFSNVFAEMEYSEDTTNQNIGV